LDVNGMQFLIRSLGKVISCAYLPLFAIEIQTEQWYP
jgi:hypothetical protein